MPEINSLVKEINKRIAELEYSIEQERQETQEIKKILESLYEELHKKNITIKSYEEKCSK